MANRLGSNPLLESEPFDAETERERLNIDAAKIGRPRNEKIVRARGPQKGLAEGWTRATFIVETDTLEILKDYAYTERITMKEAMQMALDQFIEGIDTGNLLHRDTGEYYD